MKNLKLGIIGLSEGNGHPYSWSAIFNGYNPTEMEKCPFPVIPEYLSKQSMPDDCIFGAKVTHIWTQEDSISEQVAKSTNIPHVVSSVKDMISQVDAVLFARDDAENHLSMVYPFLEAGLPIYIDKPIALNIRTAKKIFGLEKYPGQIFTCSALSFANELQMTPEIQRRVGEICHINAFTIKDWEKYAIHIIEPTIQMIAKQPIEKIVGIKSEEHNSVLVKWRNGITANFTSLGKCQAPITIEVFGNKGSHRFIFSDTYSAFKAALEKFIAIINQEAKPLDKLFTLETIKIVEAFQNE